MSNPLAAGQVVRIGTRGSALARWQADHVAALLRAVWPGLLIEMVVIRTRGDRVLNRPLPLVGGKGLFTAELDAALRSGAVDLAVHSLKDLPTELPAGLALAAIPRRANPADVLISRAGHTLDGLPTGATVGTSSRRRAAQLLHRRPDLRLADLRGNVDTRLRKALDPDGPYDAAVLAYAGLERLGRLEVVSQVLPIEVMLPAPGQGALGVQCRDEAAFLELLAPLDDPATRAAVTAERAFLSGLGGGCALPIAAYGVLDADVLHLRGRVTAPDGQQQVDVAISGDPAEARRLGWELARQALAQGAAALLEQVAERDGASTGKAKWSAAAGSVMPGQSAGRGQSRGSPLSGKRVVVTRAVHQAAELEDLLRSRGAEPLLYPCIAIVPPEDCAPLDRALRAAAQGQFGWLVLTSANAVRALAERLGYLGLAADDLAGLSVAMVGPATVKAAGRLLGLTPDLVPAEAVAEALAAELLRTLAPGQQVLLPQADIARPLLADQLRAAGCEVTAVAAYRTIMGSGGVDLAPLLAAGQVDAITFTSSSTVHNFLRRLEAEGASPALLARVCLACIGPVTAETLARVGLTPTVVAKEHTLSGLLTSLEVFFAQNRPTMSTAKRETML